MTKFARLYTDRIIKQAGIGSDLSGAKDAVVNYAKGYDGTDAIGAGVGATSAVGLAALINSLRGQDLGIGTVVGSGIGGALLGALATHHGKKYFKG